MNALEIIALAETAYAERATLMLEKHGDNASCGGAWVVIGGRGKFAKAAKASKNFLFTHHRGGFALSFGRTGAQSEFINESAARAAADVLIANGVDASVYSYVD